MTVFSTSKVYYRQSRQAPYFNQWSDSADGGDDEAIDGGAVTSPEPTPGRRTSGIRRGNSVHALLSSVTGAVSEVSAQQPNVLGTPQKSSVPNSNEADAAGGTVGFVRRVSSFQLLGRSTSTDAILRSPSSSINHNMSNASWGVLNSNRLGSTDEEASASGAFLLSEQRRRRQQSSSANNRMTINSKVISPTIVKPDWCLRDGKMKTVGIGLIMCLNIGTDPPDIVKPNPCAVLECWIDPRPVGGMSRTKARELIGERLERQYAKWQLARTAKPLKYRKVLDPSVEDVRNLCIRLRSQARNERILIHYNGHGVPRPTDRGGELWVFDKGHTEYITVSVSDLRQWMGKPSIVVLDCSGAGILIPFWTKAAMIANAAEKQQLSQKHKLKTKTNNPTLGGGLDADDDVDDQTIDETNDNDEETNSWVHDTMLLCPCSEGEWLPMHPDYPADIFTSCLTTPIPIALRWFIRQNRASSIAGTLHPDCVDQIPGKANDRKTPLGELNWIFTAVTDSIAWNVLPKPLFQRLFRQDLLVASMFRNFLLADRILRSFGCTPISYPPLPGSGGGQFSAKNSCLADHPLWQAWDLSCETMLFQLMKDGILSNNSIPSHVSAHNNIVDGTEQDWDGGNVNITNSASDNINNTSAPANPPTVPSPSTQQALASSVSSPFFSEQLTSFEIWLELAAVHKMQAAMKAAAGGSTGTYIFESPEQLPVVLQVLLSQVHRIRALKLLQRFLDLGPWAVNLSLSLGIFPYVMKLLQSPEYKTLLVSIWASILAFDPSCRVEVLKAGAVHHFVQHLSYGLNGLPASPVSVVGSGDQPDQAQAAKQRTLAAFVLAAIAHEYPSGQSECIGLNLHNNCCALLSMYEQSDSGNYHQQSSDEHGGNDNTNENLGDLHFPAHFRLWLCLCLGNIVKDNIAVQNDAYSAGVNQRLQARLQDRSPEVRAAACYALGCLVNSPSKRTSSLPSMQDLAMFQVQQQQVAPSQLSPPFNPPSGPGFVMNQRINLPPTPNLVVPGSVTIGVPPMPGQLHPSFGLAGGGDGATATTSHIQQPMQPMVHGGIHIAQGHPLLLRPQQQQQQPNAHQQLWNQQQLQVQQMMHLQQQQQRQSMQYMINPHQQQIPQMAPANPQYATQMISRGFLVPPGSGVPFVLPHRQPPVLGMPMNSGQLLQYQQHPNQPFSSNPILDQSRRMIGKPTIFEDRSRLELDLSCQEILLDSAVYDGSVVVRYEAAIALGGAIRKYLEAFVVVAEELSVVSTSPTVSESHRKTPLSPPKGLDRSYLDRFMSIWQAVKTLQREDPFPPISKAANTIVSFVHDTLLRSRMESAKQAQELAARSKTKNSLLSGIDEEISDLPSSVQSTTEARTSRRSDMRRVASEFAGGSNTILGSMEANAQLQASHISGLAKVVDDESPSSYTLPQSEYYLWKKNSFESTIKSSEDVEYADLDPLSPAGAAKAYQDRRNFVVRENGARLARRYASLAPKPYEPRKKGIEMMLEQQDEAALLASEQEASAKKSELELKEKKLFRNDGVWSTSRVNFHPYEDYLMACGATDIITLWDTESGGRLAKFENGNPKGSRMTSSFWINEESSSLFLVGCDDGTVKIWSNILESNGEKCASPPSLLSSFYAAPMRAGDSDSGLVLEWQSFSGTLLAGGSNKFIRCWDLEAEKIASKIDTNSEACVTTLTTAWDYDTLGFGLPPQGCQGIGRDVIVAGHSDGSLKIFDIRMNDVALEMRGQQQPANRRTRQRATAYNEHKSWVVSTAFTSYSNRYELISGTVSGEIKAWDLRMSTSIRTVEAQRSTITALAVHSRIPIVATGSHAQFIKILTLDGDTMQVLRYHEKMASHRIGPVSCLAFHPNKPLLAAGAMDTYIGLYTTKQQIFTPDSS